MNLDPIYWLKRKFCPMNLVVYNSNGTVDYTIMMRFNAKKNKYETVTKQDLDYLKIEMKDYHNIDGRNCIFVKEVKEGEYQKISFDTNTGEFQTLDTNEKTFLINKTIEDNQVFNNTDWKTELVKSGLLYGFVLGVILFILYFSYNDKTGGPVAEILNVLGGQLNTLIEFVKALYLGFVKNGSIQDSLGMLGNSTSGDPGA